jgi:hypothetical protein
MLQTITSSESYIILAVFAVLALVALIYLLSPPMNLLEDITIRGAEIRTRLRELLPRHKYRGEDTKNVVLAAYVDIALEHHKAIWLLSESGLNGSALALVRPILDAYFRALWVNKVASAEEIEQVWRDDPKLKLHISKMRAAIQKAYFQTCEPSEDAEVAERAARGFQLLEDRWTTLSSYVHSGGLQLGRRFTADQVKPNYGEAEIVQVLDLTTRVLMMLLRVFFASMGHFQETEEIKTMRQQYNADFVQRLRAINQASG